MSCEINNTGYTGCREYIGTISGMLISLSPFTVSKTDLATKATVQGLLIDSDERCYLIKDANYYESIAQRELQTNTTPSGKTVYYGVNSHAFSLKVPRPSFYEAQKKLIDGGGSIDAYCLIFTTNGYWIGNENGANVEARKFQIAKNLFEAEDYTTDQRIVFSFTEDAPQINQRYHWFDKPTAYDPNQLESVIDVDVTVVSASATEIVVTVAKSGSVTNVSTLAKANFVKLTTGGTTQTISTSTYADGEYTLAGTGFTTGTIAVIPLVADAVYYESVTPAAVTIV